MNEIMVDRAAEVVPATLEREMGLVRDAIALVASGGSPRVTLVGIRLGEVLLDPARRLALEAGVRVVPLWPAGDGRVDLAVERIGG